jgi:hypothetical protein
MESLRAEPKFLPPLGLELILRRTPLTCGVIKASRRICLAGRSRFHTA